MSVADLSISAKRAEEERSAAAPQGKSRIHLRRRLGGARVFRWRHRWMAGSPGGVDGKRIHIPLPAPAEANSIKRYLKICLLNGSVEERAGLIDVCGLVPRHLEANGPGAAAIEVK